mmetsp:Transcript_20144/g.50842  ORF Transcript_20144/g.50842 Transcript_20144/m.50842 type:complete len:249 (+) Transcript_20144:132-878(+)
MRSSSRSFSFSPAVVISFLDVDLAVVVVTNSLLRCQILTQRIKERKIGDPVPERSRMKCVHRQGWSSRQCVSSTSSSSLFTPTYMFPEWELGREVEVNLVLQTRMRRAPSSHRPSSLLKKHVQPEHHPRSLMMMLMMVRLIFVLASRSHCSLNIFLHHFAFARPVPSNEASCRGPEPHAAAANRPKQILAPQGPLVSCAPGAARDASHCGRSCSADSGLHPQRGLHHETAAVRQHLCPQRQRVRQQVQ